MSTTSKHSAADRDRTLITQGEDLEPISVRIATAVKLTGICRSTLYELIGSGEIETVMVGRSILLPYLTLQLIILRSNSSGHVRVGFELSSTAIDLQRSSMRI